MEVNKTLPGVSGERKKQKKLKPYQKCIIYEKDAQQLLQKRQHDIKNSQEAQKQRGKECGFNYF